MKKIDDLTAYIDPQLRDALSAMPPYDIEADLEGFRNQRIVPPSPAPDGISIHDRNNGFKARLYKPEGAALCPAILWLHGGGFVGGDINSNDPLLIQWVAKTGCAIVSVDYSLAPEHPFPTALDEARLALDWLADQSFTRRIMVAGASAGGCIAAGLALHVRDHGGPAIDRQMLIIPALDDRHITPSSTMIQDPRVWNEKASRAGWKAYLGPLHKGDVPIYAAPARAENLTGLPQAHIYIEDMDGLHDEALDYANRLAADGVKVETTIYKGCFHGHFAFAPTAPISQKVYKDMLDYVMDFAKG